MNKNPYWLLFLSLIALGAIGYTGHAAMKLWDYFRLDQQAPAQEIQWSVVPLSDEDFALQAHYRFSVKGKSYDGQMLWPETYLNEWAAQEAISRLSAEPQTVWFDSSSPEISSLQKHFPFKESLSTLILWMLALYFFSLGFALK